MADAQVLSWVAQANCNEYGAQLLLCVLIEDEQCKMNYMKIICKWHLCGVARGGGAMRMNFGDGGIHFD